MTSAANTRSRLLWRLSYLLCLSSLLTLLSACGADSGQSRLSGRTMGTSWSISYLPDSRSVPAQELQKGVADILERINSSMSTYRKNSEITRFNQAPGDQWVSASPDFFQVLEAALKIGQISGGAYDVTVGPLVDRWGFGPGHQLPNIPEKKEIAAILSSVGQQRLKIDSNSQTIMKPAGLSLDLSSIAKGYAVDKVAEYMLGQHIDNFLVEVGGEMRLSGRSARGDDWRIAIEQPDGGSRGIARTIALTDAAVATSGDYRNYFELDDKRYSHTIDPRTGHPIIHDLVSVTIVHPSAMMADGWATALTVLGTAQAMSVAQEQGLAVYFIRREGDAFLSSHSEAFAPYLQTSEGSE
jgi:FAD:protein FMN transferase